MTTIRPDRNCCWYALYTKPHHERHVEAYLTARTIATYLPLYPAKQKRAGRQTRLVQPLFPCYLFAHFDLTAVGISAVRWMPGLRDLVTFGDQPAVVAPEFIEHIRQRLAEGEIKRRLERPRFRSGAAVRMRNGPFSDFDAIFEQSLPGNERAKILIHILGRMTSVEVDSAELEPRSPVRLPQPRPVHRVNPQP